MPHVGVQRLQEGRPFWPTFWSSLPWGRNVRQQDNSKKFQLDFDQTTYLDVSYQYLGQVRRLAILTYFLT